MIFPNFFIIGAPKCGTTALSNYLNEHPQVFFSDPKEPEYFATDFAGRVIKRKEDYLRLFRLADPKRHKAIGEGSVLYIFSKVAVLRSLEFQPNAKYIVMLRNPSDLVVSLHAQMLRNGTETISSFIKAWDMERERKQGKKIPLACRDPKWLFYSEWGCIGTQLKQILKIVPRELIHIILFDDFTRDTASVYRGVLAFLNLPDDKREEYPRINKRQEPRNLVLQNLAGIAMRFWLPLRTSLTLGRGIGLGRFITKLNTVSANDRNTPEVRKMLSNFYFSEISILEDLLNRDLSCWKNSQQ